MGGRFASASGKGASAARRRDKKTAVSEGETAVKKRVDGTLRRGKARGIYFPISKVGAMRLSST